MTEYCEYYVKEKDYCKILKGECAVAQFARSGCGIRLDANKKSRRKGLR